MMVSAQDMLNAEILIVDDEDVDARLLERTLHHAGYVRVVSTSDPHEVCALHRDKLYDLILLDLQMPGMDGFRVMEALRADSDEGDLPVMVLTAQAGQQRRALEAGAWDFISKPFDPVEVKTRIHNMLELRLLHKKLADFTKELERRVDERTVELLASEDRYRRFTELASDWYWEQNESGQFTQVSGPVEELLGIGAMATLGAGDDSDAPGWNEAERRILQATIAARQPFLDFAFSRVDASGATRQFRVSGEPMFNRACRYVGYRGIGVEVTSKR